MACGSGRAAVFAPAIAALAGLIHGVFSLYWAVGGDGLIATLGHQLVDAFADRRWLLVLVAAFRVGFAALPLLLAWRNPRGEPRTSA